GADTTADAGEVSAALDKVADELSNAWAAEPSLKDHAGALTDSVQAKKTAYLDPAKQELDSMLKASDKTVSQRATALANALRSLSRFRLAVLAAVSSELSSPNDASAAATARAAVAASVTDRLR